MGLLIKVISLISEFKFNLKTSKLAKIKKEKLLTSEGFVSEFFDRKSA